VRRASQNTFSEKGARKKIAVVRNSISHTRLMRESTDRVQSALHSDNHHEQLVANRLLESPEAWTIWESEHSALMRQVAEHAWQRTQTAVLKKSALRLIHRKALFEYLRNSAVRGDVRRRIITSFHPTHSYTHAVVAEHGLYLRKACSFLCTSHVGSDVVHDAGFLDPMQRYEALYSEYFGLFCNAHFGAEPAESSLHTMLLPLLKYQVEECRNAIMNPKANLAAAARPKLANRRLGADGCHQIRGGGPAKRLAPPAFGGRQATAVSDHLGRR
jgi:hypothetical protein